jgi:hypothetical protein
MGQSRILAVGWGISAFLVALVVAVSCERQQPEAGPPDADTQPFGAESSGNAEAPAPPGPPPPPEGAFLAQLPPEQTSQLVSLGIDVVAPGAVPPGFGVVEIRTEQGAGPEAGGGSYIIVYQDPTNRCFAVEFAADGIGDPPATENRLPIQSPMFNDPNYGLNYGPFQDDSMKAQFPGSNLYSDWLMGPSGAYRLVGAAYIGSLFPDLAGCEDVAPQEAISVVESFTVLTPEGVGYGQP